MPFKNVMTLITTLILAVQVSTLLCQASPVHLSRTECDNLVKRSSKSSHEDLNLDGSSISDNYLRNYEQELEDQYRANEHDYNKGISYEYFERRENQYEKALDAAMAKMSKDVIHLASLRRKLNHYQERTKAFKSSNLKYSLAIMQDHLVKARDTKAKSWFADYQEDKANAWRGLYEEKMVHQESKARRGSSAY